MDNKGLLYCIDNCVKLTNSTQLASAVDAIGKKEKAIAELHSQALERTKELRTFMSAKDGLGSDIQAITERALKYVLRCAAFCIATLFFVVHT